MSDNNFTDKISGLVGKAKEAIGGAINNEELAEAGREEQFDAGQAHSGRSPDGEPNVGTEEEFNEPLVPGPNSEGATYVGEEDLSGTPTDVSIGEDDYVEDAEPLLASGAFQPVDESLDGTGDPVGVEDVPGAEPLPPVDDPSPADLPPGFDFAEEAEVPGSVGDAGDFDNLDDETRYLGDSDEPDAGVETVGGNDERL